MRTNYLFIVVSVMMAFVAVSGLSGLTYAATNPANIVTTGNAVVTTIQTGYSTYFYAGAANTVALGNVPSVTWTITSNSENTVLTNTLYAAVGYSSSSSNSFNAIAANVALSEFGANVVVIPSPTTVFSSNTGTTRTNANTLVFSTTDPAGSFVVVVSAISNSLLSSFTTNAPGSNIILSTNGLQEWSGIMTFNSLPPGTYNVITSANTASTTNALVAMTAFVFPQALTVSISSTPTLPATLNSGNTITFNALATGGTGNYVSYNFAIYNSIGPTFVSNVLTTSNSFVYLIPSNQVGNTLFANVVVTDNGSPANVVTSAATGLLTVAAAPPGAVAVNLGTASNFAILAESGISATGLTSSPTAITGDIGVSPIAHTAIVGFGGTVTSCTGICPYATSPYVTGNVYAADYGTPTPINLGVSVGNMYTAWVAAAGETDPTATELGGGNLGGKTLAPGLYKWSSSADVYIPIGTTLTLDAYGNPNAVWVFQISNYFDNLGTIVLSGGAQPQNIYWETAGGLSGAGAILGSGSTTYGTILASDAITMSTTATLVGRALSQTAVTLTAGDTVTLPANAPVVGTGSTGGTGFAYIAASNTTTVDAGQIENFSVSVAGGTGPYTFNIIVYNAITNLPISNDLITGSPNTGNAFILQIPTSWAGTTIYANVIVSNSLGSDPAGLITGDIANSINTPNIIVETAPTITITPSSNPMIVNNPLYGNTHPVETYTLAVTGGVGPFNIELYNVTGSTQQGSNVVIASPGGTATIAFTVYNAGSFVYNGISTDTGTSTSTGTPYVFSSGPSTLAVNQYTTQSVNSGAGGGTGGGGVTTITVIPTSTATSTAPPTTVSQSQGTGGGVSTVATTIPTTTLKTTTTKTTVPTTTPPTTTIPPTLIPHITCGLWNGIVAFFDKLFDITPKFVCV